MDLGTLLILLLVLACPLAMLLMHRGHGGHASPSDDHHARMYGAADEAANSLDELRLRRAELDAEIVRLEQSDSPTETETSVTVGDAAVRSPSNPPTVT